MGGPGVREVSRGGRLSVLFDNGVGGAAVVLARTFCGPRNQYSRFHSLRKRVFPVPPFANLVLGSSRCDHEKVCDQLPTKIHGALVDGRLADDLLLPATMPSVISEPTLFPQLTPEALLAFQFSSWYPRFSTWSIKSTIIRPLSKSFHEYLDSDGVFLPEGSEDLLVRPSCENWKHL